MQGFKYQNRSEVDMRCEFCGEPAEDDSYWVMFEGDRDETPTCASCYERLVKHLEAETSSDLDCSYCGISGSDRDGEPLCSHCLGCFECCESLHDEGKQFLDELMNLQKMAENYLPESIRDDAEAIEYALAGIHDDGLPKLNETQELAAKVVLWTVEMFEAYEEDELRLDSEGETPIMPPMGFGESVNWRPHEDQNRDRRRSEGDYSPWDYGEPPCDFCISEVGNEDAGAADEYCEVCDRSLCVGCFNDKSHDCIRGDVVNIVNAGEYVYVTIRFSDGREQIFEGFMEDVMLNDYVNSRGQTIRFNTEDYWDGRITDYGEGQTGGMNKNQFGYSETGLLKPTRSTMPSGPKKVKMVDCMRCGQPEFADELIEQSFCRKCGRELSEAETIQFNSASDAYALAYSQGHAHGRRQQPYDPKLSKEEREVFTGAWKIR
jgi:hypothetical protein